MNCFYRSRSWWSLGLTLAIAAAAIAQTSSPTATPRPIRLGTLGPAYHLAQTDDDLLAPLNLDPVAEPGGSSAMSMTPPQMQAFLKEQEERAVRAERAKVEARARFEARSRDRIPSLPTPAVKTPPTIERPSIEPPSPLIPPVPRTPELSPFGESDPDMRGLLQELEDIPSPSDLPFRRERKAPLDVEIPPPLRTPPQTPPRPPRPESSPTDDSRELPRLLPSSNDRAPKSDVSRSDDPKPVDAPEKRERRDDRETSRDEAPKRGPRDGSNSDSVSVLQGPAPMVARSPVAMPEDQFANWPTPPQHQFASATQNVHCPSCGGCVDRDGVGSCDEFQTCLGIGTRAKASCQCWRCPQSAPFNLYGPGSYAGPARPVAIPEYRLRAGDTLQLTFMIRSVQTDGAYRLVVGDELLIESEADEKLTRGTLDRGLEIQPDGTISLRFIGEVHAVGRTVDQLREVLNEGYERFYPEPSIDVTPVKTGSIARQIREAISGSEGFNAQTTTQIVSPEGTIRLPRIGAVPTQGLTLGELKREINLRYNAIAAGLEVEPNLEQQAPHYVYVLGEVLTPGRFVMDAPTTVMGGIALAGGYLPGGNLRQVVVFRRGPNWELLSTLLDLRGAYLGKDSQAVDEIWLQDNDVVIIPPAPIRLFDRFVSQVFTEGIYGIVPFGGFSYTLGNNNGN